MYMCFRKPELGLSQADLLMGVFDGGALETRTMSRVGCLDYSATPWEAARLGVLERHVSYKFNRYMSIFGGEVVSTQLKFPAEDGGGWGIHDVVTLHNVPFGDYFQVRARAIVDSMLEEIGERARTWDSDVTSCAHRSI